MAAATNRFCRSAWAKHAFPLGVVAIWEEFVAKPRAEYEPLDAIDALREKWMKLQIGNNGPFNETFRQIRSDLNPHAPLDEEQLIGMYKEKLTGTPWH